VSANCADSRRGCGRLRRRVAAVLMGACCGVAITMAASGCDRFGHESPGRGVLADGALRCLGTVGPLDSNSSARLAALLTNTRLAPVPGPCGPAFPFLAEDGARGDSSEIASIPGPPRAIMPSNGLVVSNAVGLAGGWAVAYGDSSRGLCYLVWEPHRSGLRHRQEILIRRQFAVHELRLYSCSVPSGVAVAASGYGSPVGNSNEWWDGVVTVRAATWSPRVVADPDRVHASFSVVGQGIAGGPLYLFSKHKELWQLIPDSGALLRLCANESWSPYIRVIPSPTAGQLAVSESLVHQRRRGHDFQGVYVVDVATGRLRMVTRRLAGTPCDQALAWAADRRGRLFFMDDNLSVWQLDLDLGALFPR
jgi:hypothetical protein